MLASGIFAEGIGARLMAAGVNGLVTTNTIVHPFNALDMSDLPISPIGQRIRRHERST